MKKNNLLTTILLSATLFNGFAQSTTKVKVLFLGDSLTDGFCNDNISYADKLRTDGIVSEESFKIAVTGQLLRSMSDYASEAQISSVDLVSVMGGTNQIAQQYYRIGTIDDEPTPDNYRKNKKYYVGDKIMGGTTQKYGFVANGTEINDIVHNAMYVCTKAGTSSSKDITWKEGIGTTTTDNTVTWKCIGYSSFYGDLKRNIIRIQNANPDARIVFICPTYMPQAASDNENIRLQNKAIRHFCSIYGFDCFDLCTLMPVNETNDNGNWDYFLQDMVHYNDAGQENIKSLMKDYYFNEYIPGYQDCQYTLSVTDAQWATLCVPFAFQIPDGLWVYSVSGIQSEGNSLILEPITSTKANVPYLVYAEAGDYDLHGRSEISSTAVDGYLSEGLLHGTLSISSFAPKDSYVLQSQDGCVGFYHVNAMETVNIPAHRAYIQLPSSAASAPRVLNTPGTVGIDALESMPEIQQTQPLDLWGRPIHSSGSGFYIQRLPNGQSRKMIIAK